MRRKVLILLVAILLLTANAYSINEAAGAIKCNCDERSRVLKLTSPYMSGDDVEDLQLILRKLGFFNADVTGVFGPVTLAAVKEFQQWVNVDSVGEVGPKTQAALTTAITEHSLVSALLAAPPDGDFRLVIDVDKRTLTVLIDNKPYKTFPCAVGKTSTKSPIGDWAIIQKSTNWGGGFGTRWMGLNVPWGIFGIHGTNKPSSIGTTASGGCIRMFNRDVEQLYPLVKMGTRVSIVGPYPKIKVNQQLSKGQTGHEVQQVQLSLRDAGFSPGFTDGRFGNDTEQAIKQMQEFYGLMATGKVDFNILNLLRIKR
ncbi:MAG: ErfK/YbiS/YcfS/YnhG family protein [Bacillota bacterium]|nr:MAG: ErfK/YbiS/YcfS/YnhG family protein [Bacillota bacterium]